MVNTIAPISFTAIEAKGYRTPKDKQPVKISIPDKKDVEITGHLGQMYIQEGKKEAFGPFARITVDKVDNDSFLRLHNTTRVPVKKIDTGGHLELVDKAVAEVGTIKKGSILALSDSTLLLKSAREGADVTIAHKAQAVVDSVIFKATENWSRIKVEAGAYAKIKKVSNVEVKNFSDGGFAVMTPEPPKEKK